MIPEERFTKEQLKESLESFESWFESKKIQSENQEFFEKEYSVYSLTLDALIIWNISITLIMLEESPELKSEADSEYTQKGYFTQLLILLTNNLFSVKYLYELGFDTQAKTVYRNSIEISDLALCILYRKDFFENHIKPNHKKEGNPFISPKNKTIEGMSESVMREIGKSLGRKQNSKEAFDIYWNAIRKDHYTKLSESAHGNFYHNVINSLKKISHNKFVPSISGGKWIEMEQSLSEICLHQIAMKRYFTWALDIKHDINLFDNSTYSHKMIWYLDVIIGAKFLRILIEPMIENAK